MSAEWIAVVVAIVAVSVTVTVALVSGFRRLDERLHALETGTDAKLHALETAKLHALDARLRALETGRPPMKEPMQGLQHDGRGPAADPFGYRGGAAGGSPSNSAACAMPASRTASRAISGQLFTSPL